MKQTLIFLTAIMMLVLNACNNTKSEAENQADLIQKTMKENTPGSIATSKNSYHMTAQINGKEWSASHMMPDNDERSSYKMIHAEQAGDVIKLQLWKKRVEVGKKIPFSETNMANLFIEGDPNMYSGQSGEIEITKLDDQWLQGTFHFTASSASSDKKVEVTDGSFRVASGLK